MHSCQGELREQDLLFWLSSQGTNISNIQSLLFRIDRHYFSHWKWNHSNIPQWTCRLEIFLIEHTHRKLTPSFRRQSMENIQCLASLILYIAVKTNNKQLFIRPIIQMEFSRQQALMRLISHVDSQTLPIGEYNDLLSTIDRLQTENDQSNTMIEQRVSEIASLRQRIEAMLSEIYQLEEECDLFKKQKLEIMTMLNEQQFVSYVDLLRKLNQDREHLRHSLYISEKQHDVQVAEIMDLKQLIRQDRLTITQLEQEINSLKTTCRNLRLSDDRRCSFGSVKSDIQDTQVSFEHYLRVKEQCQYVRQEAQELTTILEQNQKELQAYKNMYQDLRMKNKQLAKGMKKLKSLHEGLSKCRQLYF